MAVIRGARMGRRGLVEKEQTTRTEQETVD